MIVKNIRIFFNWETKQKQSLFCFVLCLIIFSKAQRNIYLCCVVGDEITTEESLQFDLSTIEAATNNFSADNKLGEGGFGEVYKVSNSQSI
jgi:hypothetical protein